LAISTFIIINIIFNPFEILLELGMGILFSIAVILDDVFSFFIPNAYVMSPVLSAISYPVVFYILYKAIIKRIHPI
jgi:hypothetical protein